MTTGIALYTVIYIKSTRRIRLDINYHQVVPAFTKVFRFLYKNYKISEVFKNAQLIFSAIQSYIGSRNI